MTLDRGPDWAYEAYNEQAFRHFLAIERSRAERTGRSLLLLLVDMKSDETHESSSIPGSVAPKVFSALMACVREVDFIGWYRTGRVAAAVLTQGCDGPTSEVVQQIAKRVAEVLAGRVPVHLSERIQVRVLQMRSTVKS